MILSYDLRLLCLCLASFFLVHLAAGLILRAATPGALGLAGRMRPRVAALCLLTLRLFPLISGLFAVVALCLPSYFWLEPGATSEHVGIACLTAAILGLACCGVAAARALRAIIRSLRYVQHCKRAGREAQVRGEISPVWITEETGPALALVGIVRSRIVIRREC